MKNTIKIQNQNVKMVAHRGLSGLERENTCRAFIAAGNREKYFGIETDVHRTSDGKYVTIHDGNTGRVSPVNIEIVTSTFEQVRNVLLTDMNGEADRADIRIPTLEEYISLCKKYGKIAVLELKVNYEEEQVEEIIQIIKEMDYLDETVFISFYREPLVIVRKLLPKQKIQYLTDNINEEIINFLKEYNFDIDVAYIAINKDSIKMLKDANVEVNVWTVDSADIAYELIELGVDYITTNILE